MKLLNRSAVILQPRQPYLDWINSLPSEMSELEQPLAAGAFDEEGRVYLIDEFEPESEQDEDSLLASYWRSLLENELSAWDQFADHWPEPMNQALLTEWFEIKRLPLAFDASAESLMTAQL